MMKKGIIIFLLTIVSMSIIVLNLLSDDTAYLYGFLVLILASLFAIIGVRFLPTKGKMQLLSACSVFIFFSAFNISTGAYLKDGMIQYYASFPRFFVLAYLLFVLVGYYAIVFSLQKLVREKYRKLWFLFFDLASIIFYFFALLYTTFVAPH